MVVGVLEMEFHLPECTSLKEKRQVIKSVVAQLQQKFRLAAAEVDYQDLWQRSLIGVACVAADGAHAAQLLDSALKFGERHHEAQLISSHRNFYHPREAH